MSVERETSGAEPRGEATADAPRGTDGILVSVIIPAYNEDRLIGKAIASVWRSNSPLVGQGRVEVIVTDNASTDATASVAVAAGARVVVEFQRQIARARNTGARAARGRYLIFLDADSELHPDHLPRAVALLEGNTGGGRAGAIGGGAVIAMKTTWDFRLFVGTWNMISRVWRLAAGSFLFCDRDAFQQVGGFDETLYASEELDLSQKLKRIGRERGRAFVILAELPIRTSNRKMVDHSRWEILRGLLTLALRGGRGLRDRETCRFWYPETRP